MKHWLFAGLLVLGAGAPIEAQTPPPGDTANGWNSAAARALVARSRLRREQPRGDTALRNYSAKASGYIYFYLDRNQSDEQTLVKVDQVALELYWAAPDLTKQKIVGLRDASPLPNRMYYHLDHLTVVQNGFGDVIRLGDGDEVRDVPHPAAPGSDTVYDFRIADSLTLNFAGQPPVRVFEVQTRPRRPDRSAMIGSVFIDQASADIVRMTFTFTPASYVDKRLDYINISLDNGLWSGRYWLPNEQYVEIRRQLPELDFVAGAVIKGRIRVYDYEFNRKLPANFFFGRSVEALPEEERKAFAFEEGIYEGLNREGLAPPPQVATLRAQALSLMRERKLSGLPALRLHVPNASSVARYDRAEGITTGIGLVYTPRPELRVEGLAGYMWGARRPQAELTLRSHRTDGPTLAVGAFYNRTSDLGTQPLLPRALNTMTALGGVDYLDLYRSRGADAQLSFGVASRWIATVGGGAQEDRSFAQPDVDAPFGARAFRPVRPIDEGTLLSARVRLEGPVLERERTGIRIELSAEAGTFRNRFDLPGASYIRPLGAATATYRSAGLGADAMLRASGGAILGDALLQRQFLLGGRGTLPGYGFRSHAGDAFWLVESELARDIVALGAQPVIAAVGGSSGVPATGAWRTSDVADQAAALVSQTGFQGYSYGVGVALFWDILRLDLVRGGTRSPRLLFSVDRSLWDML